MKSKGYTGKYMIVEGKIQKVSDTPWIIPPIWFPKGGHKYFDQSARRTFHDKTEKRLWMKEKGVAEAGENSHLGNPWRGLAESRSCGSKVFITT